MSYKHGVRKKTEGKGKGKVPSVPTENARHEIGGIGPHILTTSVID
jgi:hypothetical protein